MRKWLFIFLFNSFWCFSASIAQNLALNKSYSYSPKPNYPLCTETLDTVQLTDGKSSGSRWTEKSTVGWRKPEPVVEIVIDLGKSYAIEQVNVHTIGGGAATVEFPEFVAVLVSDTGLHFKFAGLVSSREYANIRSSGNRGVPHIIGINDINAAGKYVKLVVRPKGLTLFIDEVEVVGDTLSSLTNRNLRNDLETFETQEQLLSRIDEYLQLKENITASIESINLSSSGLSNQKQKNILSELETSATKISDSAQKLLSMSQLSEEKILAGKKRADIYKDVYKKPFVCLPANPMEIVYEREILLRENAKEINVQMWQNEYESVAFNIINCSDSTLKMSVSISPMISTEGQVIDSDKTFTIRRAEYVKAAKIGSIADALILQGERLFDLEPGELIQVWLTIHNPELTAGDYEAKVAVLAIQSDGEKLPIETIPISLKIQQNRLTDNMALDTCVWSYYEVASAEEMAEDLYGHHINVCIVPAQDLPFLRFSSDPPGLIRKPDYSKLDKVIKQHQYAKTFLLGLNFSIAQKDFGRFGDVQWMTAAWKRVFTLWLKDLIAHMKELGIGYNRYALYPFDESIGDEYYELAKLIKSVDPQIRLYANSFGKGPNEFKRFRELIDIWCLQNSHCIENPKWFETIKSFNKTMWTYECLEPMKAQKPYSYYRLLPWRAFQRGQTGAGFWIYYYGLNYEPGIVPWDDTLRPQGFSGVVYGAKASPIEELTENIIPSRRWQAWREGVEDYQYLYELQQAIDKNKSKDSDAAEKAQRILDYQVKRVLNNQDNCNLVYEAREILTDTLQELTNQH